MYATTDMLHLIVNLLYNYIDEKIWHKCNNFHASETIIIIQMIHATQSTENKAT